MKTFNRHTGDFFTLPVKISCLLFGVTGIVMVINETFIGIIPALISVFGLLSHNGTMIDFTKNQYKTYWGILGLTFGTWKPLSTIKILTITPSGMINTMRSRYSNSFSVADNSCLLNLKINERERIIASKGRHKKALEDGKLLSQKMKIDILDCVGKEKKLIKYEIITTTPIMS